MAGQEVNRKKQMRFGKEEEDKCIVPMEKRGQKKYASQEELKHYINELKQIENDRFKTWDDRLIK